MTDASSASPAPTLRMSASDWALLLLLSVLWGGSFFFNSVALTALPPLTVGALRVGLAAAALLAGMAAMGARLRLDAPTLRAYAGMGFLNNVVPFALILWAQTRLPSGVASILNATTPLFTVMVAHWLTRDERLTPARAFGAALGFLGVAAMMGLGGAAAARADGPAIAACLVASLSYALSGVYGRCFRAMGVSPLSTAAGQLAASALFFAPAALLIDRPWALPWTLHMPGATALAAVVGLALISTALAYLIFFRILARAGATNILLVTFLIPPSAILLGVVFLNETLAARHFLGMAMIGLGLAAIDGRPLAALTPSRKK
jgi:drug/metabolite transporter (DMT)-like permease